MGHSTNTHTHRSTDIYIYRYYIYINIIYIIIYIELIIYCRFTVDRYFVRVASKMGRSTWQHVVTCGHLWSPGTGPTMTPVRLWPRCGVRFSALPQFHELKKRNLFVTGDYLEDLLLTVHIHTYTYIYIYIEVWNILGQFRGQRHGQTHLEGLPWGFWNRREGHLWPKSNCMAGWQCE